MERSINYQTPVCLFVCLNITVDKNKSYDKCLKYHRSPVQDYTIGSQLINWVDYDYLCVSYLVSGVKRCSPNKIEPDSIRLCSILFDLFDLFENRPVRSPNAIEHESFNPCSIRFLFDFVRSNTPGVTIQKSMVKVIRIKDMITAK